MPQLHINIVTRTPPSYQGALISGEFFVDGARIPASLIYRLILPWTFMGNEKKLLRPGKLILTDGTTLVIHAVRQGWLPRSSEYAISGNVTLRVKHLEKSFTVQVQNIMSLVIDEPTKELKQMETKSTLYTPMSLS